MNANLFLEPKFSKSTNKLILSDPIFLIGSCFSENISLLLKQRKFQVLSNPNGILFDALSIERCLEDICCKKVYQKEDLFLHNELYGSWNHHTSFSDTNADKTLETINTTIQKSYEFLKKTNHAIITLGSAFSYLHLKNQQWVSNCHKVPQVEFKKTLVSIADILTSIETIYSMLLNMNPKIHITLTISPVRHLRDGVIDNNRSKARLIEAVYRFVSKYQNVYYFPSYEIVIDVLRDYRFYDIDYAHPNFLASHIVFNYFRDLCIEPQVHSDMEKFYSLYLSMNHKAKHANTSEHFHFLKSNLEKAKEYKTAYPHLDFSDELNYFESSIQVLKIRS